MLPINEGVVMPPKKAGGRPKLYPLPHMKVGDSFVVPKGKISSVRSAISRFAYRNPGHDFTTRVEGDNVRVWRVA